ncbi:MAG: Oligopeptide transport ATP-binding protein OppD [Syntrophorhabdaceae bacterium PtaU1.Bin034]|nr:MAG: Oligopeptide transport ATP-binding protein OppD [Syntrophorhabdaceae bacterium PtaU1.Bin034]
MKKNGSLLSVSDLHTYFFSGKQVIKAVQNVSFEIKRGEVFGLVGESGCGKTMTALSVIRLVPVPGKIVQGSIDFEGKNLVVLSDEEMQQVRGGRIGMIFQEPLTSLNPVLRIGDQISETLLVHKNLSADQARSSSIELLAKVGLDRPEKRYLQYPHQLSGGQRQRVLIAIAIACHPALIIADEPTTALDVTIERQILRLLQNLVGESDMSMLFITHNLNIIKRIGQRIGVMYAGRMVEQAPVNEFFENPLHPYSKGLLASMPQFSRDCDRLSAIPGSVPRLSEIPQGCTFHPRCPNATAICTQEEPPPLETGVERWVRCFLYQN